MKCNYVITFWLMHFCVSVFAQNQPLDTLKANVLKGVLLYGAKGQKAPGVTSRKVSDAEKKRNVSSLTETLRYNTSIIFKDLGNGGISTASFRGTSSTNTQVLWNGIGINAVGTGQTDFNTVAVMATDDIEIQAGGSSAENGSGAIGGVVKLNNHIEFQDNGKFELFSSVGSFGTTNNYLKIIEANSKWSLGTTVTFNKSDNDYPYLDDRFKDENGNSLKNLNGNYRNYSIGLNYGYKINTNHKLYYYSSVYDGTRLFSAGLPNPKAGTEKNIDKNTRNLIEYKGRFWGLKHNLKVAYLTQEYQFFNDRGFSEFSYGRSRNYVSKYSLSKKINQKIELKTLLGFDKIVGETNQISTKELQSVYQLIKLDYRPLSSLNFSISTRNEEHNIFELPLMYSGGADFKFFKYFTFKTSYSKNFRVPTFNELFWPQVGNINLVPEIAKQYDVGLHFKNKWIKLSATYFNINLVNRILWLPTGGTNLWRPRNVDKVFNEGLELFAKTNMNFKDVAFHLSVNYSLIASVNLKTAKSIPFVPDQAYNVNAELQYKKGTVFYQQLFQDKIYTIEDKIDFFSLDAFTVSNLGVEYNLIKKNNKQLALGGKMNNVFNKLYSFTNLRPMPGRNYNISINYKF